MQKIRLNSNRYFIILLIVLVTCFISCVTGQDVSSLSNIGDDKIVLVGKVILEPALNPNEYRKLITMKGTAGNIYLHYSYILKQINSLDIGFDQVSNSIKTDNGKTFYVKFKRKPIYFYYGFILMDINEDNGEGIYAYLPAEWVVDPKSEEKAIYIGTIKYTRDEFFRITKVEIIDEYDTVSKEFYAKYGNSIPLKKSLLKSM